MIRFSECVCKHSGNCHDDMAYPGNCKDYEPKNGLFETACEITRRRYAKHEQERNEIQAKRMLNINMIIMSEPFNCVFAIDGEGENDICILTDNNNICPYFESPDDSNCLCPLDSGNILIRRTNESNM